MMWTNLSKIGVTNRGDLLVVFPVSYKFSSSFYTPNNTETDVNIISITLSFVCVTLQVKTHFRLKERYSLQPANTLH